VGAPAYVMLTASYFFPCSSTFAFTASSECLSTRDLVGPRRMP
jgi:hypothetical protein